MPPGTALGRATITVITGAGVTIAGNVQVDTVAPAVFTINSSGSGAPAAQVLRVRADGSQSTELVFSCGASPGSCVPTPIDLGPESEQVFLSLFGTGIRGFSQLSAVSVHIGGEPAEVLGAAPQPQFVGLDQVNARLSRRLIGRGQLDVTLNVDGKAANNVVINIGGSAPPPAGTNYLPVAPGIAWTYRVTFGESARLPYQPTFEQSGLFCTSLHCGFRTWDAGMTEFQMIVGERFDDPAGGDSYRLTTTGQANEFFFANSQDRLEIRVRRRGDADQLELVGFLAFRSYRPLARFQSSDLASTQTVTVPAGTYQNSVRTFLTLNGGSSVGNETWTTEVFLAPGVGIIRAVMRDSSNKVLYTQELTSFTAR
jgi:uncharacterized protein (TIGR03437 family)